MEWALVVLLVFLAMTVAGVVVAVRRVVREVGRRAGQAQQELRRRAERAALTARANQPGPVGEVARIRKDLRASVANTRSLLLAGVAQDDSLREALALCEQLAGHAERLDGELHALVADGERNRAWISARLPELRGRAERIRASAESLREAARERARHDEGGDLDSLQERIALETKALRHWSPAERPDVPAPGDARQRRIDPAGGGPAAGGEPVS
ncbi:hypothetical protein RM844_30695 [Streptomyces sp. DSM 44915]|uniref:Secreted protein n=1 Tax=Streptomyces chisholmiae TaxID=3075540 RepID=A0ABU2K0D1_9ACTN|nr:hypothetical protein [Streptomyces sp. DSM 44915]MDT0270650.1 hypothetical protein [Streptomyces sp. DSM 44915]